MRIIKQQRLAHVSPWVLAAACGLLALIIGVFAVNNYRRDKALMTDILLEKGTTLIRFVSSSARSSLINGLRAGQDILNLWPEHVQRVLEHASEHPGVRFLALVDAKGIIQACSTPVECGRLVSEQTRNFLSTLYGDTPDSGTFHYRIGEDEGRTVFQIAALFSPLGKEFLKNFGQRMLSQHRGGQMFDRMKQHQALNPVWIVQLEKLNKKKIFILVELDLDQFNKSLGRKKLEIVILSIVLLLVGVGGWLSILTLEGLKGSQSRLRRVEAFRDILISSLPVGLIATNNAGRIVLYNQFSQELTGIPEKKALGGDPGVVLTPELGEAFEAEGVHPGIPFQKEIQIVLEKGVSRTLHLNRVAIIDRDDKFVGTLLVIQDLSQVKKLEEELRRSERLAALGKMAAGVAHELRNPLSSIKGLALLLRSRFIGKNSDTETADILVQEVERLNRSICELLDYARPQKLLKETVDLQQLLQKAVSLIRIDAEAAGVEVVSSCQESLPKVLADEDKLNQVFLNLFLNGIQAMEQGGGLTVEAEAAGAMVEIKISDTGCGIASESLDRVFDPYYTSKPEGTGLGLAMSAKIVEEHGGSIKIVSQEGQGTSVIVRIPC
ncbi:MAG: PAS domain-containing protein [Proteobacteria bacterium]|nr:PAS domain-containing protein [Pseudomonadota bacterium]MBU1056861.1 PAS domain-containing protein [Pseudomonadota bacterium]